MIFAYTYSYNKGIKSPKDTFVVRTLPTPEVFKGIICQAIMQDKKVIVLEAGVAKLHPDDSFEYEKGRALAIANIKERVFVLSNFIMHADGDVMATFADNELDITLKLCYGSSHVDATFFGFVPLQGE